ncbi:MAG: HPr family phosphocarrier protein [Clostridia bacterium]|nr:HPr family phosphocarrier protein [Clostridia bacterium]
MRQVYVRLTSAEQVQNFVKTLTTLDGDFELVSGKHLLDARSLMGLFSLDLSYPIPLKVYNDCAENLGAIKPFLSESEENDHE